jgi:hypothetical protein
MSWPRDARFAALAKAIAVALGMVLGGGAHDADGARPQRWTERQAESALLSRANISYADCVPLGDSGRRFQCIIEFTDGGERFLVLIPQRDGFAVRSYERT